MTLIVCVYVESLSAGPLGTRKKNEAHYKAAFLGVQKGGTFYKIMLRSISTEDKKTTAAAAADSGKSDFQWLRFGLGLFGRCYHPFR